MMGLLLAVGLAAGGGAAWASRTASSGSAAAGESGAEDGVFAREYQIKAAFCYKFLFFSEWHGAVDLGRLKTITIGVVGNGPADQAFAELDGQQVKGKTVSIVTLDRDATVDDLGRCQLLFFAALLQDSARDLVARLGASPALTVSDGEGFAEAGGMIELMVRDDKVRFVVNRAAAGRAGISFRARLLRLAEKVLEDGG